MSIPPFCLSVKSLLERDTHRSTDCRFPCHCAPCSFFQRFPVCGSFVRCHLEMKSQRKCKWDGNFSRFSGRPLMAKEKADAAYRPVFDREA